MSELSPDARDLIAQAKRQGSEVLGPSAEDRARLRDKLTPLWAAEAVQRRPASGVRWKIATTALIVGLSLWGFLNARPEPRAPSLAGRDTTGRADETLPLAAAVQTDSCGAAQGCPSRQDVLEQQPVRTSRKPSTPSTLDTLRPMAAKSGSSTSGLCAPGASAQACAPRSASAHAQRRAGQAPAVATLVEPAAPGPRLDEQPVRLNVTDDKRAGRLPLTASREAVASASGDSGQPPPSPRPASERTPERAVRTDENPAPASIDGELELLGAAQTALQKQRPTRALSLLQEHAFRFPTGSLIEERMAMQALALCALQRRHAAETVLSNLAARGSTSQLLPRVRSQCGL